MLLPQEYLTRTIGRARAGPAALALIVALLPACDEPTAESAAGLRCDGGAPPLVLRSKPDDDDGDGNIYDENFPVIDDEDDDIADHTWIRDRSGIWHLFFHTETRDGVNHIAHYRSRDLASIEYAGVALIPRPGLWDADALWAPHVVEHDDLYYMFYTGVTGAGADAIQRIGVAVSRDLDTWTRVDVNHCPGAAGDGCVYECRECWTTWDDAPGFYNQQCRDAFVTLDPARGTWTMFVTARSTNGFGVVSVAGSPDLLAWAGTGFIDATRRLPAGAPAQTTGGQAENPFVIAHAGLYYLLFTDWEDDEDRFDVPDPRTIVQYATSTTLAADSLGSTNWRYRGYTPDPGVNASEGVEAGGFRWILSQSISNPNSGFMRPDRRILRLTCIEWREDGEFTTSNIAVDPPPAALTGPE